MTIKSENITTDYQIIEEQAQRTKRGILKARAGWNVYNLNSADPTSNHPTREEAIAGAHAAQEKLDARRAERKAEREAQAAAEAERKALEAEKGPLATPRQVNFIMQLIHEGRHREGGFYNGPTEREGVERMSKASASTYITSLLGKY